MSEILTDAEIKKLRSYEEVPSLRMTLNGEPLYLKAINTIEALQAQNHKLIEALERISENKCDDCCDIIAENALATLPPEALQAWKLERDVVKAVRLWQNSGTNMLDKLSEIQKAYKALEACRGKNK